MRRQATLAALFTSQDGNRAADVRRRRPARSFEASRIFRDANVLVIRALRKQRTKGFLTRETVDSFYCAGFHRSIGDIW